MSDKNKPYTEEEWAVFRKKYNMSENDVNSIRLLSPRSQRWLISGLEHSLTEPDLSVGDTTIPYPDDVSGFFFKPDGVK